MVPARELPVDPETRNYVRTVPNACYSRVAPEPLRNPALVAASKKVGQQGPGRLMEEC